MFFIGCDISLLIGRDLIGRMVADYYPKERYKPFEDETAVDRYDAVLDTIFPS